MADPTESADVPEATSQEEEEPVQKPTKPKRRMSDAQLIKLQAARSLALKKKAELKAIADKEKELKALAHQQRLERIKEKEQKLAKPRKKPVTPTDSEESEEEEEIVHRRIKKEKDPQLHARIARAELERRIQNENQLTAFYSLFPYHRLAH